MIENDGRASGRGRQPTERGPRQRGPKPISDPQALFEYAVAALGRQMRTVAQLRQLLRKRVPPEDAAAGAVMIDGVLSRLKDLGYLSDARFSASYSTLRKENQRWGRRRVEQDLLRKGVHPDVIAREVGAAYEGTNEEAQAREFLTRRRVAKPVDQRQAARVFRMLARAGYSPRVAIAILRRWDVDPEALAALEDGE